MSNLERFAEYAEAFEASYADDDWSRLEAYFTPDAVYAPGDGSEVAGRDNVLRYLQGSVSSLDRRFDSRAFGDTPDPTEADGVVTLIWELQLRKQGLPDLTLSGRELVTYRDGAIARMEDVFDEGVPEALGNWMSEHANALD